MRGADVKQVEMLGAFSLEERIPEGHPARDDPPVGRRGVAFDVRGLAQDSEAGETAKVDSLFTFAPAAYNLVRL